MLRIIRYLKHQDFKKTFETFLDFLTHLVEILVVTRLKTVEKLSSGSKFGLEVSVNMSILLLSINID
jgi:hypothetical protein